MDSLESNCTCHLVDLPPDCQRIGCKWVLRKKLIFDGIVNKYEANLVAKRYIKRKNVGFFGINSPVTNETWIRVYKIGHQMNVETTLWP